MPAFLRFAHAQCDTNYGRSMVAVRAFKFHEKEADFFVKASMQVLIAIVVVVAVYVAVMVFALRARNTDLQIAEQEGGYGDPAELVLSNKVRRDCLNFPVEETNSESTSELAL